MRVPTACLFAFLLGVAPVASAQNLITNGDFSSDVSGWSLPNVGQGTLTWSGSRDAGHDPNSGSGLVENLITLEFGATFASQCIPVPVPGKYDVGAEILFEWLWQSGLGRAFVVVNLFDGNSCTGNTVGGTATPPVFSDNSNATINDVWILSEELGFESPPSAVSAQIKLYTIKVSASGTIQGHFDNVEMTFVPEPSAAAMSIMALMALGGVRRARRITGE